ncbi:LLM class flavin-dependent oxidoreductase [Paenibacillus sp. HB172176]|uniref:LLM class flavin-dependent oxidoreductase n=1 Tax=Paenibacillus sp. HB172176 TaxID=2493690 RepID=UPI00143AEB39|nr:LLM class flavin-dependent oxidoreductase [Paenibacillus sp. HB172176]
MKLKFRVFADLPSDRNSPIELIEHVAKLAENYGYEGVLIFFGRNTLDPVLLSSIVLRHTSNLIPLLAAQPYYASPVQMARIIESIFLLHNRKINLNMITGADPGELNEMHNTLDHGDRYKRVVEYVQVLKAMLMSEKKIAFQGDYYSFAALTPHPVPPEYMPKICMAGSSPASIEAASQVADVAISHPEPIGQFAQSPILRLRGKADIGMRIGILARETREEAWRAAHAKYKLDHKSLVVARMKLRSESSWNKSLAQLALQAETHDDVYWLGGFLGGDAAPILVGDYASVSGYLRKYAELGVNTLLLDSYAEEDFYHTDKIIEPL